MDYSDIQKGLSEFVVRYDSQTFLGSFRETSRDSLLNEGLSTRANSLWKMAEYVVAKFGNSQEPIEKYISGWTKLAENANNQKLLIEVRQNVWEIYNAKGILLGGEDFIKDFFAKKKKDKLERLCQRGKQLDIHLKCLNWRFRPYITAIKSKPFLLLAGISGTGKSRIVRELARACWDTEDAEYKAQKPRNFEMVQVKPNWHDSTELIGYVSRVSGDPVFVAGDFLKFVARAWEETDVPYFLCLDEMNLAPVEQYFAEYLSVVESRKSDDKGNVETDPILKKTSEQWYYDLTASLPISNGVREQFNTNGITLPPNLIVVGTVNMDETTFSFSRKVLDRAMTIEMNEVNLYGGLEERYEYIGKLCSDDFIGTAVEGVDVYADNKDVCDKALSYLKSVNGVLEGTPFKVAYRTRNEFLLYVVNNLPYDTDENGNKLTQDYVIARALDEITNMKILPRIEGDDTKVKDELLDELAIAIKEGLKALTGDEQQVKSLSLTKLDEMKKRLQSGYTSYWS